MKHLEIKLKTILNIKSDCEQAMIHLYMTKIYRVCDVSLKDNDNM